MLQVKCCEWKFTDNIGTGNDQRITENYPDQEIHCLQPVYVQGAKSIIQQEKLTVLLFFFGELNRNGAICSLKNFLTIIII